MKLTYVSTLLLTLILFSSFILPSSAKTTVLTRSQRCRGAINSTLSETYIGDPPIRIPRSLRGRAITIIQQMVIYDYSSEQAFQFSMNSLSRISNYQRRLDLSLAISSIVRNHPSECD